MKCILEKSHQHRQTRKNYLFHNRGWILIACWNFILPFPSRVLQCLSVFSLSILVALHHTSSSQRSFHLGMLILLLLFPFSTFNFLVAHHFATVDWFSLVVLLADWPRLQWTLISLLISPSIFVTKTSDSIAKEPNAILIASSFHSLLLTISILNVSLGELLFNNSTNFTQLSGKEVVMPATHHLKLSALMKVDSLCLPSHSNDC